MAWYVLPNDDGGFSVVDGELWAMYPQLFQSVDGVVKADASLIAISDEHYQAYCNKGNVGTRFVDGKFVFPAPQTDAAALLAAAKATKLTQINNAAQTFVAAASGMDKVPDFELRTWALQAIEAKAWHDNPDATTPILDQIAISRGIAADQLKAAAYRKSVLYELLTAHVAGQRQALETRINASKSVADVDAVDVKFTAPTAPKEAK